MHECNGMVLYGDAMAVSYEHIVWDDSDRTKSLGRRKHYSKNPIQDALQEPNRYRHRLLVHVIVEIAYHLEGVIIKLSPWYLPIFSGQV